MSQKIKIRVLKDPQPEATEPEFVKEAYVGLVLTSEFVVPKESSYCDEGLHMVRLSDLLSGMATHNGRAYAYLRAVWGESLDAVSDTGVAITVPIPFSCCEQMMVVS